MSRRYIRTTTLAVLCLFVTITLTASTSRASTPTSRWATSLTANTPLISQQPDWLHIPFPSSLNGHQVVEYQAVMKQDVPMQGFTVQTNFSYTQNSDAILNSTTGETDELSVSAGQYSKLYTRDVEWGIVARPAKGSVDLFLQLGDGTTVLWGGSVQIHTVDNIVHTYGVSLARTASGGNSQSNVLLSVTLDGRPAGSISKKMAFELPSSFGIVSKTMRVSPDNINLTAELTLEELQIQATSSLPTPIFGGPSGILPLVLFLGVVAVIGCLPRRFKVSRCSTLGRNSPGTHRFPVLGSKSPSNLLLNL